MTSAMRWPNIYKNRPTKCSVPTSQRLHLPVWSNRKLLLPICYYIITYDESNSNEGDNIKPIYIVQHPSSPLVWYLKKSSLTYSLSLSASVDCFSLTLVAFDPYGYCFQALSSGPCGFCIAYVETQIFPV